MRVAPLGEEEVDYHRYLEYVEEGITTVLPAQLGELKRRVVRKQEEILVIINFNKARLLIGGCRGLGWGVLTIFSIFSQFCLITVDSKV